MRTIVSILLFMQFSFASYAQKREDYTKTDALALQIPDSLTKSTKGIAKYINSRFNNQSDKARAVFIWIAGNIGYDIENINKYDQFYSDRNELIKTV